MIEKAIPDGRLELTFQLDPDGKTYLAKQYFNYPFHVCRAQYMDKAQPDMATMYLQSCSGGIFSGDRLETKINVKQDARAHVTTQASTISHRMQQGSATQNIEINVDSGALIEYLPECSILFPEAKLSSSLVVTRQSNCSIIVADSFLNHDPNGKCEQFSWLKNELIIRNSDGKVDAIDRFFVTGEQFRCGEISGFNAFTVHGTFAVISDMIKDHVLLDALRSTLNSRPDIYSGASRLPNNAGCLVRYMAQDGALAKSFATDLWFKSREILTGHPPDHRRK